MTPSWTDPRDELHHEIANLRQQVADRDDIIRQLREIVTGPPIELRRHWKLTISEERVLVSLLGGRLMSRSQLMFMLYQDLPDAPDEKLVDVYMSKIRTKLRADGIEIETLYNRGWRMDKAMADRVRALCDEKIAA